MTETPPTIANAMAGEQLRQMIMGFRLTQMISVAAQLGIADQLRDGPQTPAALAAAVGADEATLYRLLRALGSLGIFAETPAGTFVLTPLAELLRSNVPGSLRGVAMLYGETWLWQAYGELLHSVRTGQTAFEHAHGMKLFDYLDQHPAAAETFHAAMTGFTGLEIPAILAAYRFPEAGSVIDLGGGQGTFMAALLAAYPKLAGTVFDLPDVLAQAKERLAAAGVAARASFIDGNFFEAVPEGHDVYLLKRVIHDWNDREVVQILRSCRRACGPDAQLLVIERVIPAGNVPAEAKLFDINMLVSSGGKERSEQEYRTLFQQAGFEVTQVLPTSSLISVIEARPV